MPHSPLIIVGAGRHGKELVSYLENPPAQKRRVRLAGFVDEAKRGGPFAGSTVLGDFAAGPSHTLPTSGAGRAFSGLRTTDFMRRTSLVEYTDAALIRAAPTVAAFAAVEKLPLHGESLAVRAPKSQQRPKGSARKSDVRNPKSETNAKLETGRNI